jgi:methylmalonyl-CoA carboxyltransferase large subunit
MHMALRTGSPFVFINDSGGARVQEGVDALNGYGKVFYANVLLSGVVPQISILRPVRRRPRPTARRSPTSSSRPSQAQMFITGPQVIKQVTGEEVTRPAGRRGRTWPLGRRSLHRRGRRARGVAVPRSS